MEARRHEVTWPKLQSWLVAEPGFDTKLMGSTISALHQGDPLSSSALH